MLGVKAMCLKEERVRRRDLAEEFIEECEKDLKDLMDDEERDINTLMNDMPLDGLGLRVEHLNSENQYQSQNPPKGIHSRKKKKNLGSECACASNLFTHTPFSSPVKNGS